MTLLRSALLSLLVLLILPANAELAPKTYLSLQKAAPEVLQIQIATRKSSRLGFLNFTSDRKERLEATVLAVTRSKSGLKKGDKIVIIYEHKKLRGAAGPSPIPKLTKGQKYPAWLKKDAKGHYSPAARGYSFHEVKK